MSQATESCWNYLYANFGLAPEDREHGKFYVLVTAHNKMSLRETWFPWDDLKARAAFAAWANEAIREGWRITTSGKVYDAEND